MRTNSPDKLVRNNSRPYLLSSRALKLLGTLRRPLSSIRAGTLPLHTQRYSTGRRHDRPRLADSSFGSKSCQAANLGPSVSYAISSPLYRPSVVRPRVVPYPRGVRLRADLGRTPNSARGTMRVSHAQSGPHRLR